MCEIMQRFDERLKELGSLFCNGNYLSGAKKHGKLGKVRVNYPFFFTCVIYRAQICYTVLIYCIFLQEQRLGGEASVLIQALLAVTEGLLCSSLEGDRWAKNL